MKIQKDRKRGRCGDVATGRKIIFYFVCFLLLFVAGCSRRNPAAEKQAAQAAIDEFFAMARSCVPAGEPEDRLKLAIAEVANQPNATRVRLVAYALDEAVDFDFPVYLMSAGRWVINEKGRAYLLNEQCREFVLKDRKSSSTVKRIPREGRIKLDPGQAFEVTLIFNRLPDQTRAGALVYAGRILPFTLHTEAPKAETK